MATAVLVAAGVVAVLTVLGLLGALGGFDFLLLAVLGVLVAGGAAVVAVATGGGERVRATTAVGLALLPVALLVLFFTASDG